MSPPTLLYLALILAGIVMLGLEIYVPGGVLGVLGLLCLAGAVAIGFTLGPMVGWLSAAAVVLGTGIGVWVWIRWFPRTRAGQRLTLTADGRDFKAPSAEWRALVGMTGEAVTDLRPAGIARIGGRRVDVTAEGTWIEAGRPVRVVAVDGVRIVVRAVDERSAQLPEGVR
ncbi:MAG: hypothetical protein N2652_03925 [Kiritimatiellae bacterium]|nr:hypothetical protein [Kiritimatiellia bacterium]